MNQYIPTTKDFSEAYWFLYEKKFGEKPKLHPRVWRKVNPFCLNFADAKDVMQEVIKEYFMSDMGYRVKYSVDYLCHEGVTGALLETVRDRMKRKRDWEQGQYTKNTNIMVQHDELKELTDAIRSEFPDLDPQIAQQQAKKRLENVVQ